MKNRKLRLHRETIRRLDPDRLRAVAGGTIWTNQHCATVNNACVTFGEFTCDCGTLEGPCNSIDLCQPGSEGCTRPVNICTQEMGTCQG